MLSLPTGLFSFQFRSVDGLDAMLENGMWFIHNNLLILKKWNPDVNLLIEDVGNVSVWVKLNGVPVMVFSEDGLSAITTKLGTPLIIDSYTSDMCLQSWGRSSYTRAMIELLADVELKDTIVVAFPKLTREGLYTWTSNLASKEANHSGSSLWNVETSSPSNTSIVDKMGKFEKLLIDGKDTLVDDEGKPLKKVDYPGDHDIEDEVQSADNDMTRILALEKVGFGINSLLKQQRDSYENADYDYDLYEDDIYDGQEIPDKIQSINEKLDIKVRGRKKK
ncbi:putative reverse transcriptase domain-containing protein [Tanacetum coccineum]